MIRYRGHATADELASLALGGLRPRKAARIESHVGGCQQCTQLRHQLDSMPTVLASARYPPMPEGVSVRIEATLAVEARQRLAELPATEAGRGDLPARHRTRVIRPDWHLPGLSVSATRLVAAAGALVVVAGGGYAIASQALSSHTSSPSAGSAAAAPAQVQQMSLGPEITYGAPSAPHTVHAVQSGANFVPASLSTQAVAAVHAAQARGASVPQPTSIAPGPSRAQSSSTTAGPAAAGTAAPGIVGRLSGCLNLIAAARNVLLVDIARFQHKPATLIVIAAAAGSPAEAWVVGSSCSATNRDVLGHAVLSHLK